MKQEKYFLKGWSVTSETVEQINKAVQLLQVKNNELRVTSSAALRVVVSLGLQQLEKQKEGA